MLVEALQSDDKKSPLGMARGRFEEYVAHLAQTPFAWFVIAEPIPRQALKSTMQKVALEMHYLENYGAKSTTLPPGTLPDQPPSSPPDASADQPGHNFKVTANPDQLIDYTFDSKRGCVSFQHKLDNPKIMGGPTDTTISFGKDGIDYYEVSVKYPSVIREGVAAREVAERPDVDQVRWGEPARDLIKERISPDELGSKREPVAVDIIGVKGDLNDNPRFDLAEGKGTDLKKALDQFDDNAWHLRPPGGQGGENIDRIDMYIPDGAIDRINQNSEMTNLRVNETTGILETRPVDPETSTRRLRKIHDRIGGNKQRRTGHAETSNQSRAE